MDMVVRVDMYNLSVAVRLIFPSTFKGGSPDNKVVVYYWTLVEIAD